MSDTTDTSKDLEKEEGIFQYNAQLIQCLNLHNFRTNTALLIPFSANDVEIGDITFVGEDMQLYSGASGSSASGFLLACPECGKVQLHGFKSGSLDGPMILGKDNAVEVRNLSPEL